MVTNISGRLSDCSMVFDDDIKLFFRQPTGKLAVAIQLYIWGKALREPVPYSLKSFIYYSADKVVSGKWKGIR